MGLKMTARDIMTRCVRTVTHDSSLTDATALMDRAGYGQVPVVDGNRPVALLTEADARRALEQGRQNLPVVQLASPLPRLVEPGTRISGVLQALQEQDSLLVVSPRGTLQGIITYWDVLTLARPHLVVKEVELLLRSVVSAVYEARYGQDWWRRVPENLRSRAEEEHQNDRHEAEATPEHMLGHTSFWSLIEILRHIRPDLNDAQFEKLHDVREMRNRVAHYYRLLPSQQAVLVRECRAAGDWLQSLLPADHPLRRLERRGAR